MEGTLPRTETGVLASLRRPEAAQRSEAGLKGILPREDIPPRTGEIRPDLIPSPTPGPDRTGGHLLDRTIVPTGISLETDPSLDTALSPTGLRANLPPEEMEVPVTLPLHGAG